MKWNNLKKKHTHTQKRQKRNDYIRLFLPLSDLSGDFKELSPRAFFCLLAMLILCWYFSMAFLTAVIGYQFSPVCRGSLSRVGWWVILSGTLHRHDTNTSSVWKTLHRLSRVQQKFILFSLSMWRIFFQFKCKKKKFDQNKDILRSVSPLLNCIYLMNDVFIVWLFLVVFVEVLVSLEGDLIRMKTNIYLNDTLSFLYLLSSPSYFYVCVQHLDDLSFVMQVRRYMFLYLVILQSITVTATRFH